MHVIFLFIYTFLVQCFADSNLFFNLIKRFGEHTKNNNEFGWLIEDLIDKVIFDLNCLTIMTDNYYNDMITTRLFHKLSTVPVFKILVKDNEDLLSPNYDTLSVVQQARRKGCNAYIILIANADQIIRLLRFGDRHRVIDTRARYIMLYDLRLFKAEYIYLWKKIVNVIFILKFYEVNRYEFMTVPYPSPLINWKPVRIDSWKKGKFQKNNQLFFDKTSNLNGEIIHVATFEYMPSALKKLVQNNQDDDNNIAQVEYSGLEIQIMESLSLAMNFQTVIYEPPNSEIEAWGRKQLNGSYTGLLGEMVSGRADFGLGNFLYTPSNLKLLDLSIPYTTQCFTFLTPESTTDNSWKTLVLPFKRFMWLGVILTLLICTLVFYGLAKFHKSLEERSLLTKTGGKYTWWRDLFKLWHDKKNIATKQNTKSYDDEKPTGLYLFSEMDNSIINAYSMLLLVSLPKMPSGWSLRMFTGWWWLYCILVTVAYRASMTAILANPAQRVTIDTLEELAASLVTCGGWGEQNKEFFTTSLDSAGQRVGRKFEIIYDSNAAINRVAKGDFAYYENIYFLHNAKAKQKVNTNFENETLASNSTRIIQEDKDLHIMGDCIINMPISLGLQKNSPLKPRVDKFLQRVIEAGLVKKWLGDVMLNTTVAEPSLQKSGTKAVMDLKKFVGALVALLIGYALGTFTLLIENIYWYYVVKKNPLFDKYRMDCYFTRVKR